jgi:hypothetical protein
MRIRHRLAHKRRFSALARSEKKARLGLQYGSDREFSRYIHEFSSDFCLNEAKYSTDRETMSMTNRQLYRRFCSQIAERVGDFAKMQEAAL